jgi:hypothetical protein
VEDRVNPVAFAERTLRRYIEGGPYDHGDVLIAAAVLVREPGADVTLGQLVALVEEARARRAASEASP